MRYTFETNGTFSVSAVMKDGEQIGSVFMRDGLVAWAVSNNQTENFGSFLERIGLIPKEKLNEIAAKYRALGKAKKLGTLLEELQRALDPDQVGRHVAE